MRNDYGMRRNGRRLVRGLTLPTGLEGEKERTDSVEETVDIERRLLLRLVVDDFKSTKKVSISEALERLRLSKPPSTVDQQAVSRDIPKGTSEREEGKGTDVPHDGDLGVGEQPLGHDLARSKLGLAHQHVHVRSVLSQV